MILRNRLGFMLAVNSFLGGMPNGIRLHAFFGGFRVLPRPEAFLGGIESDKSTTFTGATPGIHRGLTAVFRHSYVFPPPMLAQVGSRRATHRLLSFEREPSN